MKIRNSFFIIGIVLQFSGLSASELLPKITIDTIIENINVSVIVCRKLKDTSSTVVLLKLKPLDDNKSDEFQKDKKELMFNKLSCIEILNKNGEKVLFNDYLYEEIFGTYTLIFNINENIIDRVKSIFIKDNIITNSIKIQLL